jgi:hypothetical protein
MKVGEAVGWPRPTRPVITFLRRHLLSGRMPYFRPGRDKVCPPVRRAHRLPTDQAKPWCRTSAGAAAIRYRGRAGGKGSRCGAPSPNPCLHGWFPAARRRRCPVAVHARVDPPASRHPKCGDGTVANGPAAPGRRVSRRPGECDPREIKILTGLTGLFVKDGHALLPRAPLRVIDLTQIEDLPLHHRAAHTAALHH